MHEFEPGRENVEFVECRRSLDYTSYKVSDKVHTTVDFEQVVCFTVGKSIAALCGAHRTSPFVTEVYAATIDLILTSAAAAKTMSFIESISKTMLTITTFKNSLLCNSTATTEKHRLAVQRFLNIRARFITLFLLG